MTRARTIVGAVAFVAALVAPFAADAADTRRDPFLAFSFRVTISSPTTGSSATGFFKSVGGLSVESEVVDYHEGGLNDFVYRLPTTLAPELAGASADWAGDRLTTRDVTLDVLDGDGTLIRRYAFLGATLVDAAPGGGLNLSNVCPKCLQSVDTAEVRFRPAAIVVGAGEAETRRRQTVFTAEIAEPGSSTGDVVELRSVRGGAPASPPSLPSVTDLVIDSFDPSRNALVNWINGAAQGARRRVTITSLVLDRPAATTYVYSDCLFTRIKFPDVRPGSGLLGETLTLRCEQLQVK